jgi:prepilin-type N-terminal cleavage/methylation domain-containing protein
MRDDAGFSLMEVLMSMVLLGVVGAGLAPGMLMNVKAITRNELRSESIAAAQQVLDDLRTEDPTTLPSTGDTEATASINGRTFDITTYYCLESTICDSGNSRHLTVEVRYKNERIYGVETVFTQLR